jgi:hypothetical protein
MCAVLDCVLCGRTFGTFRFSTARRPLPFSLLLVLRARVQSVPGRAYVQHGVKNEHKVMRHRPKTSALFNADTNTNFERATRLS